MIMRIIRNRNRAKPPKADPNRNTPRIAKPINLNGSRISQPTRKSSARKVRVIIFAFTP
jgi:hypothetical protein